MILNKPNKPIPNNKTNSKTNNNKSKITPIVRLSGNKINLCVLRTDDEAIETYTRWMNDETINMWIGNHIGVFNINDEKKWAERERKDWELTFNIVEKETNKLIGNCSLSYNRITAYLGICIGEESGRDKGYGTEVIGLLIKYAFNQLNMHRVELCVNGNNIRAIKCYEKNGFKECGRFHESEYYNGQYCDILCMEILRNDWKEI
jgi:RimJ/RimL family protein N-acetyltransferase